MSTQITIPYTGRISSIDAVRAFAALSVMFAHLLGPILPSMMQYIPMIPASISIYTKYIFTGHPAVIVFFVISGFCIHYPYSRNNLNVIAFVSARWVRVLIPAIIATGFANLVHIEKYNFVEGYILWSIVCELIYYTLYPLFYLLSRWISWRIMFAIAMVVSTLLSLLLGSDQYGNAHHYGPWLNWIISLPSWLIGCVLAEKLSLETGFVRPRISICVWRGVIAIVASILCWMTLNTSIGYYLTMNLFSILVYFWLREEIIKEKENQIVIFEWIGRWSFSIYLYHVIIFSVISIIAQRAGMWLYVIGIPIVLFFCYIAYLIIELPSHHFARYLFKRLQLYPSIFNLSRS